MASHAPAPAPHLPTESESPTLRSLLSVFGAGPKHHKSEVVTAEKHVDEDVRGQLPLRPARNFLGNVSAVGKVIWAFTKDDLFTATLPNAIFSITAAIADAHLRGEISESGKDTARRIFSEIIAKFPVIYLFSFYSLLIFHLGHQRPRENHNKPPRRLFFSSSPSSGKPFFTTTPEQIRSAYLILVPISLALNHYFGVWHEGLMIHLMTFIFNELVGGGGGGGGGGGNSSDEQPFVRDIILGIAFGYINSASLKIALSGTNTMTNNNNSPPHVHQHSPHTWTWLNLVSILIATTIGCQEFNNNKKDNTSSNHEDYHHSHSQRSQEKNNSSSSSSSNSSSSGGGEANSSSSRAVTTKRKRALAIFLGEAAVPRAQLAMMMPLWTLVCAVFWRLKVPVAATFVLYSLFVASRVLTQRSVGAEARTWRFWARWTAVVYMFPLVAVLSAE